MFIIVIPNKVKRFLEFEISGLEFLFFGAISRCPFQSFVSAVAGTKGFSLPSGLGTKLHKNILNYVRNKIYS
jgi:hypothetical protein